MMRGSSGASFRIDPIMKCVHKRGGYRVGAQGKWLYKHNGIGCLPCVYEYDRSEYRMEFLHEIDLNTVDHKLLLEVVCKLLRKQIWSLAPVVKLDLNAHIAKRASLRNRAQISSRYYAYLAAAGALIEWETLETGLIHGDPIIDNVMREMDSDVPPVTRIVIIDPLPATPTEPDILAVDRGKLLQSALGYESIRYDLEHYAPCTINETFDLFEITAPNERLATVYFTIFHFMRTAPYINPSTMKQLQLCLDPCFKYLQETL